MMMDCSVSACHWLDSDALQANNSRGFNAPEMWRDNCGTTPVLSAQKLSRDGWIETSEDREKGVASVSAPIRDGDGNVIAALSLSGPLERITSHPGRMFGAQVVAAAQSVTGL